MAKLRRLYVKHTTDHSSIRLLCSYIFDRPPTTGDPYRVINFPEFEDEEESRALQTGVLEILKEHFPHTLDVSLPSLSQIKFLKPPLYRSSLDLNKTVRQWIKFLLLKDNQDTHFALSILSATLKIPFPDFNVAGAKDKHAITVQQVTFPKGHWDNISKHSTVESINHKLKGCKLLVGNFEIVDDCLRLSESRGNRFEIVIRDVELVDQKTGKKKQITTHQDKKELQFRVRNSVKDLETHGFINYFGLQRFGSGYYSNHTIGKLALKKRWKELIFSYFLPRPGDFGTLTDMKTWFMESGDAIKTIEKIGKEQMDKLTATPEVMVMKFLAKYQKDKFIKNLKDIQNLAKRREVFKDAWLKIPSLKSGFYVHSYQSYVWNTAVSERQKYWGLNDLHIGDLVQSDDGKSIEFVTEKNISKYNISHLVLPVPGSDVQMPNNQMKHKIKAIMEMDGISLESFANKNKALNFKGDYRRVICFPKDVTYEILETTDPNARLVSSDLDLLRNEGMSLWDEEVTEDAETKAKQLQVEAETERARRTMYGVRVGLTLPKASYATMALRELCKSPIMRHWKK
eukprot:TRINITY_DN3813_c0_g1_i1.p1 TRINITY_DN3813_c0_g1~~TRINITY_DN3813_c0_g1_i1.p1  ORF type:complete len:671 (+),score=127.26 TRINITY_DN3813_c0_g1_i1:301-2013(+)